MVAMKTENRVGVRTHPCLTLMATLNVWVSRHTAEYSG